VHSLCLVVYLGSGIENGSGTATAPASTTPGERVQLVRPTLVINLDEKRSVKSENIAFVRLLSQLYEEGEELVSPMHRHERSATAATAAVQSEATNASRRDQDGVGPEQSLDGGFSPFPDVRRGLIHNVSLATSPQF